MNRSGGLARRWLALATAAVLLVAGAVLGVSAPASAAPADTIYSLVNQARAAQGLRGLLRNPGIDSVALSWANQMAANGAMTHNPNYAQQMPGRWTRAGENVANGYPTAQAVFDGWMNSPGHRANILGDFTDIGIAFISANGTTWAVQDFGKYAGHAGPPAPAPAPKPAPPPVAAPPSPPAPTAVASASPSATPSATPSAQRSAIPRPSQAVTATPAPARDTAQPALLPRVLALAAAVILIAAAFALTLRRKRRPS